MNKEKFCGPKSAWRRTESNAHPHSLSARRLVALDWTGNLNYDRSVVEMEKEMTDEEIKAMVRRRFIVSGRVRYRNYVEDKKIEDKKLESLSAYSKKLKASDDIPNKKGGQAMSDEGKVARFKANLRLKKYRKNNSVKDRCREKTKRAIYSGKLVRKPCERCGAEYAHGHHPDYSKPLEIVWLCSACRGLEHSKNKVPNEIFLSVWNAAQSPKEVAIKTGISIVTCRSRAQKLRLKGLNVKRYPKGPRTKEAQDGK